MSLIANDKLKFIGCEIIHREACKLTAASPFRIDLEFLRKGLHDLERSDMHSCVQSAVDAVSPDDGYQAILIGYGRCNDGVVGLASRTVPLVVPKAHDCITFFFGNRSAYQRYFDDHPGTYFHTTGWLERNDPTVPGSQGVMSKLGLDQSYEQLVEKYGRDNAEFILATMGDTLDNYSRICYLDMCVTDERQFISASRALADDRGWQFEHRKGDWSLLCRLFNGDWDNEDFLIVPPGRRIVARNDGEVLAVSS